MATVVGVRFRNAGKLYYFDPLETGAQAGDTVIVETARGQEMGEVVTGPAETDDVDIQQPLRPVLRVASQADVAHKADNKKREAEAFEVCRERIAAHQLPMKLVSCEYTFDNSKLLFYFTSDKRVDFRALVKDLASVFHIRIELRQIGVRDEARMMGGLGICGRPLCCTSFLGDFHPVSIKMAKEQNLSLNPIKISGACGRLMCCLQYEEEFYEKTSRQMPRPGKAVHTPDGDGIVADVNILRETVRVKMSKGNDTFELREYPAAEVTRLTGGFQAPSAVNTPEDDEDADPEIVKVLQASEMDVPDDESDSTAMAGLLEDEASAEVDLSESRPRPGRRPERGEQPNARGRQRNAPRRAGEDDKDRRRDQRPGAPRGERPPKKPAPAEQRQPKPAQQKPQPSRPEQVSPEQPKPEQTRQDPWTVPEEYRVKPMQ